MWAKAENVNVGAGTGNQSCSEASASCWWRSGEWMKSSVHPTWTERGFITDTFLSLCSPAESDMRHAAVATDSQPLTTHTPSVMFYKHTLNNSARPHLPNGLSFPEGACLLFASSRRSFSFCLSAFPSSVSSPSPLYIYLSDGCFVRFERNFETCVWSLFRVRVTLLERLFSVCDTFLNGLWCSKTQRNWLICW